MADFGDDFKTGDTVTVGPIGEGTKRRNDARNERIEKKANNNANKSPVPKTSGQTTTETKKVVGSIERLNISQARKKDPEYAKIRAPEVRKRLKYSGLDVASERNPDGILEARGMTTTGSVRLVNKVSGEQYDYPDSGTSIPGYKHVKARRDKRLIETKSDGKYRSGIIEGTIEPIPEAKGTGYKVTRKEVTVKKEVVPSKYDIYDEKRDGESGNQDAKAVVEKEIDVATADASEVDGSGGGHVLTSSVTDEDNGGLSPGALGGRATTSQEEVSSDHTKVPVEVQNEIFEDGSPVPGSGGVQYLTEDEVKQLEAEGRIKPSDARDAKAKLKAQKKSKEKGTWPVPEDHTLLENGEVIPNSQLARDEDGNLRDATTGSAFTGFRTDPEPTTAEQVTASLRAPRVATGMAGIPSEHKIRLFTKDPSWLQGALEPLIKTGNGIVFPYTPTINVTHSANYGTYDINQSVNQPHYYMMTPNVQINVTAIFTANTVKEAHYMLAAMHFLRTATKSDFGAYANGMRRTDAGTPPPVLVLSGYGADVFNHIPCVLRNVNFTLPEDVDYVAIQTQDKGTITKTIDTSEGATQQEIDAGAGRSEISKSFPAESSSVPTSMLFAFDVAPQYPPSQLRDEWNWKEYASGDLLRKGYI